MNEAIISGEYVTFKHVKTRKVVVLEIEVSEERFQEVISKLGMPIGGESKHVAVALLDKSVIRENGITQTEGDKLRVRAVMLCKEFAFNIYAGTLYEVTLANIELARAKLMAGEHCQSLAAIYYYCNIRSRSELTTNIEAQTKFKELLAKFDSWKLENQYADNLDRI